MLFKTLKKSLTEAIYDGQMEMRTSDICVSDLEYLEKFAKQMSGAFQSSIPNVLTKIETELNKFGCTLGELDSELPFEDSDSEDFAIFKFAMEEMVTNAYLTLSWEITSGQQNQYRPDGSKLRYDIHLEVVRNNPMDDIGESGDTLTTDDLTEETEEDYDSSNAGKRADLVIKRVAISKKIEILKQDLIDSGVLPKNGGIKPDAPKEVMENPKVKEILRLRAEHDKLGEDMKKLTEETGLKTYEVTMKDGTKKMIKGYSASHLKTYDDVKSAKLVKEATDPSFKASLKNLSDSQLKAKLKYFRDKDQDKYNALVSEFESRGIKESTDSKYDRKVETYEKNGVTYNKHNNELHYPLSAAKRDAEKTNFQSDVYVVNDDTGRLIKKFPKSKQRDAVAMASHHNLNMKDHGPTYTVYSAEKYNQLFKESVEQLDESTVVVKQKPTSVIFEMGPDKVEFSLKGQEAQFKLMSESGSSSVTMNPKQTQKFFEGLTEFYISKTSK